MTGGTQILRLRIILKIWVPFLKILMPASLLFGYHNVTNQFKHIGQPEDTDNFVGL